MGNQLALAGARQEIPEKRARHGEIDDPAERDRWIRPTFHKRDDFMRFMADLGAGSSLGSVGATLMSSGNRLKRTLAWTWLFHERGGAATNACRGPKRLDQPLLRGLIAAIAAARRAAEGRRGRHRH